MVGFARIGVALLVGVSTAWAWQQKLPVGYGDPAATAVTTPLGDVVVARCAAMVSTPHSLYGAVSSRLVVAMLRGTTGVQRWQRAIPRTDYCVARHLIADDAGNVIVFAWLTGFDPWRNAVTKLSSLDGHELWRHEKDGSVPCGLVRRADGSIVASEDGAITALDGETGASLWSVPSEGSLSFLAADPAGDVFGVLLLPQSDDPSDDPGDLIVQKLDGGSGAQLWRRTFDGTGGYSWDVGTDLAVDEAGDVVVVGWLTNANPTTNASQDADALVTKLAGGSGEDRWRVVLAGATGSDDRAYRVKVAPGGDPVVGLHFDGRPRVTRLVGTSGAIEWQTVWGPGDPDVYEYIQSVAIDASGEVFVLGGLAGRVAASKFSGTSGDEQWLQTFIATRPAHDQRDVFLYPQALAVGPRGEVMLAGTTTRLVAGGASDAGVAVATVLSSTVRGKRLVIRDDGALRKVTLVMRDPYITPALPHWSGDPSVSGASLALSSSSGDHIVFTLPADGWSKRVEGGYAYRGTAGPTACPEVVLAPGALTARCRTDDAGLILDAPLGSVDVTFTLGEPGFPYCASFGGTVKQDRPVSADAPGIFRAIDASPPVSCG